MDIKIPDKGKHNLFMPDISIHICRGQANKIANWFPFHNWEALCVEENQMHSLKTASFNKCQGGLSRVHVSRRHF